MNVLFDRQAKCMLTFTGQAPAGQYFIYLMAEDFIPVPKISQVSSNGPLSSVPVHLSLTGQSAGGRRKIFPFSLSSGMMLML